MFQILSILSIFAAASLRYAQDFHGHRLYLSLILAALWIGALVWQRVHWSAGLSLGWALISATWIFGNPVSPYLIHGDMAVMAFDSLAGSAAFCVLVVTFLLVNLNWRMSVTIMDAFSWLCVVDSVFVVAQWIHGNSSTDRGGFFGNASMNACVIAFTYPILKRWKSKPKTSFAAFCGIMSLVLPILAVLISRSNMGLATLIAAFIAPILSRCRSYDRRLRLHTFVLIALLLVAGHYFMGAKFGDNNGRWIVQVAAMHWWTTHSNIWIGTGLGSYFILGPSVQVNQLHQMSGHLLWLHCDWLQVLFEEGVIGFVLIVVTTISAVRAAAIDRRHWLVSSLCAYSVTMLGNFPMHLPVSGFFGAFILVMAFDRASMTPRRRENR